MASLSENKYRSMGDYHWQLYYSRDSNLYQKHVNKVVGFFKNKRGRLLDVGCGAGLILNELNKIKGLHCIGIDNSQTAIELAHHKNVNNLILGDFMIWDWQRKERFDYILMGDVLEHIADPREALKKAKDALKPDGILYVSLPIQTKKTKYDSHLIPKHTAIELLKETFFRITSEERPDLKKLYFIATKRHTEKEPEK